MIPSTVPTDDLVVLTTTASLEAGIRPADWERLLSRIEPLRTHSEGMYRHSLRVGLYANGLAADEQLDAGFALHGGCAHDIGKCAVSIEVLDATDFGERERQAVSVHPQAGFETLAPTHLFSAFVAGMHHQFQDAPYGMDLDEMSPFPLTPAVKANILEMSELVATADFFDALTSRADRSGQVPSPREADTVMRSRFGDTRRVRWLTGHAMPVGG